MVNTLVVTTVSGGACALLGRVGATRGQLGAMFGWQWCFVVRTGSSPRGGRRGHLFTVTARSTEPGLHHPPSA